MQSNAKTSIPAIIGFAIHLVGFALGYASEGLVLQGVIGIQTGIASLAPAADLLYMLGLVIVVASAGRALVPFKCLVIAGIVIGVGFFYKSAPHEIHIASGIGFGLGHPQHIGIGAIIITVSLAVIFAFTLRYGRHA